MDTGECIPVKKKKNHRKDVCTVAELDVGEQRRGAAASPPPALHPSALGLWGSFPAPGLPPSPVLGAVARRAVLQRVPAPRSTGPWSHGRCHAGTGAYRFWLSGQPEGFCFQNAKLELFFQRQEMIIRN